MSFNSIKNIYSRFLAKIKVNKFNDDCCWFWIGASKGNGYGSFVYKGKAEQAHRVSYKLFIQNVIPNNCDICHTCDNRMCVNPDHLFVGTRKDNMVDMKSKGRGSGGSRKHLLESQIQEIKQRLISGHSIRQIALSMDINYHTILSIKNNKSYVS